MCRELKPARDRHRRTADTGAQARMERRPGTPCRAVRRALAEETVEGGGVLDRLAGPILEVDPRSDVAGREAIEPRGFADEFVKCLEVPEVVGVKDHGMVLSISRDAGRDAPTRSGQAYLVGCDPIRLHARPGQSIAAVGRQLWSRTTFRAARGFRPTARGPRGRSRVAARRGGRARGPGGRARSPPASRGRGRRARAP